MPYQVQTLLLQVSLPGILHITLRWFSSAKTEPLITIQRVLVCVYVCMYVCMYVCHSLHHQLLDVISHIVRPHQTNIRLRLSFMFLKAPEHKKTHFFCVREIPQKFWKQPNSTVQRIPRQRLKTLQTMRHTAVMHKLPYMHAETQFVLGS